MFGRPSFTLNTGFRFNASDSNAAAVPRVASNRNPRAFRSLPSGPIFPFVSIVYAQEDCAFERQALSGGKLGFGECLAV